MQIFELHFNPKADRDKAFDTFIYEPENLYEKRLGSLYMAGELKKPLLRNPRFLTDLSSVVKKEYYGSELKKTPEAGLKEALKKANDYLDGQVRQGNVGWLGNLSFAVLNYNDYLLNFAKGGDIKILLGRGDEFLDIGENLEMQSEQVYPLRVFGNIASGKLALNDKVLVVTKDAFAALSQSGSFLIQLNQACDEKGLKEVIKNHKPLFAEISGICLVMMATEKLQQKRALTFRKELPAFSFKETLWRPLISFRPSLSLPKPKLLPKLKTGISLPKFKKPKFKLPVFKKPVFKKPAFKISVFKIPDWKSKKIRSIVLLIVFLLLSFWIFKQERETETTAIEEELATVRAKIDMAENFLIIRKEEEAKILLEEAKEIILPLRDDSDQAKALWLTIQERLKTISIEE